MTITVNLPNSVLLVWKDFLSKLPRLPSPLTLTEPRPQSDRPVLGSMS